MIVEMSRLTRVFGDRILVRRLTRPEKTRGLFVPASYAKDKPKEQAIWYGIVEKFGLDSRYGEAYGLKEGDIIGINDIANSNASFIGDDGEEHFWIMEEFVAMKDDGLMKAHMSDKPHKGKGYGIYPIGQYTVVEPYPEESKRGGIIIPDGSKTPNLIGKVMAVSNGVIEKQELKALRVTLGADVLFGKYSGLQGNLSGKSFLLIKEEDLISELLPAKELAHA